MPSCRMSPDDLDFLPPDAFRRADETPDERFYAAPRFVTHIDDLAIAAVTQLYREYFPPGGHILDLMSSWISHLPPEVRYAHVTGLGLNAAELAANERLNDSVVQNLNEVGELPFASASFDGCGICVSVDYLTRPVEVLREVGRVLRPGAPVVVTFSNRCFPTKAVRAWLALNDEGHVALVAALLRAAGNFDAIVGLDRSPVGGRSDPLYAVVGRAKTA